jgi:hypothetical protein
MASYKISPAGSIYATGAGQHAFNLDSKDADTFVVDPSAFLIATGAGGNGAVLASTKPWQATINGSIISTTANGLHLAGGNSAASKISVGTEGSIAGADAGVSLNSAATLANAGTISGTRGIAIENAGAHVIKNTGTIYGNEASIMDFDGLSNETVTNSGTLGGSVQLGGGNDAVTNSGTIASSNFLAPAMDFGTGTDTLTNSGYIYGDVYAGEGNDSVVNSKFIAGIVNLGNGDDTFRNSGQLVAVSGGQGKDNVTNSGSIYGDVNLQTENDVLTNSGLIDGNVYAGAGNDKIINSKTIGAAVYLEEGDDFFSNSGTVDLIYGGEGKDVVVNNGVIIGRTDLGSGDDRYTGGAKHDGVQDGAGSDTVSLGGANDYYLAVRNAGGIDGTDVIDGGSGTDQYDASNALGTVSINLDTVAHDLSPYDAGGLVAANTAHGTDAEIGSKDTIKNFEDASGGAGNDFIYGNASTNFLFGNGGFDVLYGFAGSDELFGGGGGDSLFGGAGRDHLEGGAGNDTYYFASITESGITVATRDLIDDFENGFDQISLANIDANSATKGVNDAFTYIGTNVAFSKTTGELRAYWTANGQIIEGDVNGDGRADFSIELTDPNHAIALDGSDFLL